MQCFCQNQSKKGVKKEFVYTLTDKVGAVLFSEPICQQFLKDMLVSKILSMSIPLIIIVWNLIL